MSRLQLYNTKHAKNNKAKTAIKSADLNQKFSHRLLCAEQSATVASITRESIF